MSLGQIIGIIIIVIVIVAIGVMAFLILSKKKKRCEASTKDAVLYDKNCLTVVAIGGGGKQTGKDVIFCQDLIDIDTLSVTYHTKAKYAYIDLEFCTKVDLEPRSTPNKDIEGLMYVGATPTEVGFWPQFKLQVDESGVGWGSSCSGTSRSYRARFSAPLNILTNITIPSNGLIPLQFGTPTRETTALHVSFSKVPSIVIAPGDKYVWQTKGQPYSLCSA